MTAPRLLRRRHAIVATTVCAFACGAAIATAAAHAETRAAWTDRVHVTAPVTSGTWGPTP